MIRNTWLHRIEAYSEAFLKSIVILSVMNIHIDLMNVKNKNWSADELNYTKQINYTRKLSLVSELSTNLLSEVIISQ